MALQVINLGNYVNDGTGDDLRTAFSKVNDNFNELELQGGQANTISNIGLGSGLYKEKIGVDLRLKSLIGGTGITLVSNPNDITIEGVLANAIVTVNGDDGSIHATINNQAINVVGGNGIHTHVSGTTLTINGYTLETDTNPILNANLNLNSHNIVGGTGTTITASNFVGNLTGNVTGNLTGLVNGLDVTNIYHTVTDFDFGKINGTITTFPQFYLITNTVDMGSFLDPSSYTIDFGTIR